MEPLKQLYNSAKFHYNFARADCIQRYYSPSQSAPDVCSRPREARLMSLRDSSEQVPKNDAQEPTKTTEAHEFLQTAQMRVERLRNMDVELRETLASVDFDQIIKQKCLCVCHEPESSPKTSIARLRSFSFKKKKSPTQVPFILSPVIEANSLLPPLSQASSQENRQQPKNHRRLSVGSVVSGLITRPSKADVSQSNPQVWKTVINEVSLSAAKITSGKRPTSTFSNLSADFTSQNAIGEYRPHTAGESNFELDLISIYR